MYVYRVFHDERYQASCVIVFSDAIVKASNFARGYLLFDYYYFQNGSIFRDA